MAPPDAGEGVGGFVVLDEVVHDSCLLPLRKGRLPWDGARAYVDHAVLRRPSRVLDVNHRETARPAPAIHERIPATLRDPVEIHLECNVPRIAALQENVVRNR